ncbi:hypothetical protein [uncultured Psychrobacillus sp.]|uniref:hypothetical protein n=1 Tax=uncultured Psychrobacillus sp. TaxID=1551585 RepID=UPI00263453CE|nr:hypothetical protein [uncultured Psychrobacillus sp.]
MISILTSFEFYDLWTGLTGMGGFHCFMDTSDLFMGHFHPLYGTLPAWLWALYYFYGRFSLVYGTPSGSLWAQLNNPFQENPFPSCHQA